MKCVNDQVQEASRQDLRTHIEIVPNITEIVMIHYNLLEFDCSEIEPKDGTNESCNGKNHFVCVKLSICFGIEVGVVVCCNTHQEVS